MDSEQKFDNCKCTCRAKGVRPSSECIRKNGFYRRGRNKVQRYKCNLCERVFSFPPKKKRKETRGRPFRLLERPLSKFEHWEDYYLIQIIGKLSALSGRGLYEELWDFTPLSKKELAPKISRNIKFSNLEMCRSALAYLNKQFPIMCRKLGVCHG
ncbi:hypothetical protein [Halobacteriovorax sp. JY17]|uniref:hypothetical protein n=1 Tax=Halobacteriovorax sp. JY17 TaxID=2014617 RepID=UPI000C46F8FF|nr:hypothetical protein [Halobacteriovorax sp. JY17]PIK13970.1 MAG: hypothetical protein CES88_13380 [Halobacteriovorax sp. JY17]